MRRNSAGMTLIEVLVAMVIMTVALAAGSTLIIASHTSTIKSDLYNVASAQASNAVAADEANGYATLTNGTTTSTVSANSLSGSLPDAGIKMTTTTTIGAPVFNTALTNIKEVDITVSWTAGSSASSSLAGQVMQSTLISAP